MTSVEGLSASRLGVPQVPHRSSFETILRGCLAKCNIVRSPLRQYVTSCVKKTLHFVIAHLRFELRVRSPPVFPTGNQAHRMFAHTFNSRIQLVTRMLGAQRPSTEGWFSRVKNNNCPGVQPRLLHPPLCQPNLIILQYMTSLSLSLHTHVYYLLLSILLLCFIIVASINWYARRGAAAEEPGQHPGRGRGGRGDLRHRAGGVPRP